MSLATRNRRWKRATIVALAVVLAASVGFWGFRYVHSKPSIPTAVVRRAAFVDWIDLHGQVQALQSDIIEAPPWIGSSRVLTLVANGMRAKKGQVLVRFDATQLQQTLAQDRVALKSAEAVVEQARAKARIKEDKDLTDVTNARYNVQKAQLEASKAEIVSQIQGEENKLKLTDARQQLAAAQAALKNDRVADASDIRAKEQALAQDRYQVQQDQLQLGQLTLRAPRDGVVSLLAYVWDNASQQARTLRPGDSVWPGAPIAEMPDLSKLEVVARVDETERGRLSVGQKADIRFSAIPGRSFTGRLKDISTISSVDFSAGWPPTRNFTVRITLQQSDPQLRPEMTGTVRVAVDRVPNGIVIPSQAVFRKNGERIAYVLHGSKFESRRIVVSAESGGQTLVAKGLASGERVALKNPEPQS